MYLWEVIANVDFRTYCNTFWNIFGTTKDVTKCGPSDPVFITKIFKKYKKIWEPLWTIIFFICENLKLWKCWKVSVPNFSMFNVFKSWNYEVLNLRNCEILKFPNVYFWKNIIINSKVFIFGKLHFEIWKSKMGTGTWWRFP